MLLGDVVGVVGGYVGWGVLVYIGVFVGVDGFWYVVYIVVVFFRFLVDSGVIWGGIVVMVWFMVMWVYFLLCWDIVVGVNWLCWLGFCVGFGESRVIVGGGVYYVVGEFVGV